MIERGGRTRNEWQNDSTECGEADESDRPEHEASANPGRATVAPHISAHTLGAGNNSRQPEGN